jgi:small GTP-binding protein
MSDSFRIKVVVVGDAQTGKTSLVNRFVNDAFSELVYTTVSGRGSNRTIQTDRGSVILEIWDTAGQEQYRSLTTVFFRNCGCILIVYDVTNRQSLTNVKQWLDFVRKECPSKVAIFLVGNKADLDGNRAVNGEEASALGDELKLRGVFECSAKSGMGVEDLFVGIGNDPEVALVGGKDTDVEAGSGCCELL